MSVMIVSFIRKINDPSVNEWINKILEVSSEYNQVYESSSAIIMY